VLAHIFGHPCRLEELLIVAQDFNLVIIEDAAESLGSFIKGNIRGLLACWELSVLMGTKKLQLEAEGLF